MVVVFRQADLDTCVAGAILGAGAADTELRHRPAGAHASELADPAILVIEAGGSGDVARGNFDHHAPDGPVLAACRQAFEWRGEPAAFAAIANFAAQVDTQCVPKWRMPKPNLSQLVSGLRLLLAGDPLAQFREGMRAVTAAAELGLDPWKPIPLLPEWRPAFERRAEERQRLASAVFGAEVVACGGWQIGYLTTEAVGGVGLLYRLGADIAVVENPAHGIPPKRKFTIAAKDARVDQLVLDALNAREPGWGGPAHGTIIGSPWAGSQLTMAEVRRLLEREVSGP